MVSRIFHIEVTCSPAITQGVEGRIKTEINIYQEITLIVENANGYFNLFDTMVCKLGTFVVIESDKSTGLAKLMAAPQKINQLVFFTALDFDRVLQVPPKKLKR